MRANVISGAAEFAKEMLVSNTKGSTMFSRMGRGGGKGAEKNGEMGDKDQA
jgi:hypothetical protein